MYTGESTAPHSQMSCHAFSGNTLVNKDPSLASVPEVTYLFFFCLVFVVDRNLKKR